MANLFLDLPAPAGEGTGVAVDTSAMGKIKTITVSGEGFNPAQPFVAAVAIEYSVDGGVSFVPLQTFLGPGKKTVGLVADRMRVRVSARTVANNLNIDVAANDDGAAFVSLPVPAGDGTGAAVDTSALGTFNTIVVTGPFSGAVAVEISEDGSDWVVCSSFSSPGGGISRPVVAQFMRVRRSNVSVVNPGTPTVSVGAANDPSGGGAAAVWSDTGAVVGLINQARPLNLGAAANAATGANAVTAGSGAVAPRPSQRSLSSGSFAAPGDAQSWEEVVRTSLPGSVLTLDGGAEAAGNSLVMPDRTIWLVEARAAIFKSDSPITAAGFVLRGLFSRDVGAASVLLIGTVGIDEVGNNGPATAILRTNVALGSIEVAVFAGEAPIGPIFRRVAHVRITEITNPVAP